MWGIKITLKNGDVLNGWYAVEENGIYELETKDGIQSIKTSDIEQGYQYAYGKISTLFENGQRVKGNAADWRPIGSPKPV